jgi:hypothetical protein
MTGPAQTCVAELPEFAFYRNAMRTLSDAGMPYLVGGAYAYAHYTGIERHTKDIDVFAMQRDVPRILEVLDAAGYTTEITSGHWLAKAFCGEHFVDIIYGSGNGICVVDEEWFTHALQGEILGVPVRIIPAEEMIWSKAFIMERERYDGGDVNHILRACAHVLDWPRVLRRFGANWQVLLSHLVLFTFAYPVDRGRIPERVLGDLLQRMRAGETTAHDHLCRGTLLSRKYMHDVRNWGYHDARLRPWGNMTPEEIAAWAAAFDDL